MPGLDKIRFAAAALLLLAVVLAAGCGDVEDQGRRVSRAPFDVLATTIVIGALAEEVAGDTLTVRPLIGPGVDAHDYEPTADDIKDIGDAKVVLRNGIGLDDFLESAIEGSGTTNIVTVTEGIEVRRVEEEEGEEDPHVWHDPMNAKIMVDNIVAALSAALPDDADAFRSNGDAYKAKLDATDTEIRALIDAIPVANRKMVTNHDAFGYFIERYGLTYVGAVIPSVSTQGEASAQQLAKLEDTIKREGVKAIFAESSVDPKIAREIANDTDVKIVDDLYGDSLGEPGSDADTVDGMLLANARKIADALK